MRKIPAVIYQEVIPSSVIALLVLTFIVFTKDFGRLAEMLIRKNADLLTIGEVVLSLLPGILVFTLPFAFLIGTLIGFSRLSVESEVVAMRAGGVSVAQMLWPVFKLSLWISLVTLGLMFFLLPMGNWNLRQLRHEIGLRPVQSQIRPRVFNEDFAGKILYVEDIDLQSFSWEGVFFADSDNKEAEKIILSRKGHIMFGPDAKGLQLHFERGLIYQIDPVSPEKIGLSRFETLDVPVYFPEMGQVMSKPKRSKDKILPELLADIRSHDPARRRFSHLELQRRIALPISALIFAVLGVTLGIRFHRGGRGYGFVMGVIIAFIYYVLFTTGTELAVNQVLPIGWGTWGANLLLGLLSVLTLRRATVEFGPFARMRNRPLILHLVESSMHFIGFFRKFFRGLSAQFGLWFWNVLNLRPELARVIDLYMMRILLLYWLPTLVACVGLFYLSTFFELIDDILANRVPYWLVIDYFLYLLPHALMMLIPISILIAILVTFGILEKTSQMVAFKACGVSLYRTVVPILSIALVVSSFVFVIQEYVLPYANQRQSNLRAMIKGRPIQTYYQMGRNWIFGKGNRLYHYNYFDSPRDIFAELSVYDLDIGNSRLNRHIYAQKAEWDTSTQSWKLLRGWSRTFENHSSRFETFEQKRFSLPEKPDYFDQEVKESSKMTYAELKKYIKTLQQGGFEVDHLKTDLYEKLALPCVTFIMAILGIPFALSIGRKGTLHGIAAGVLLGILYWGFFGLFGVLGSNGMLAPFLAAWGANILFGGCSILLLFSAHT